MASKRQAEKQANGKQAWVPPRGIRYSFDETRPKSPFYLHWRDDQGKRKAKGYETEKARELAAKALDEKRSKHGDAVLTFDPDRWARYLQFQKIVGADVDPIIVAHEWRAHRQGIGVEGATGMTVREAFKKYLALREADKLSDDTTRHITKHVGERFCGEFGERRLNDITADDIREWLADLSNPKTGEPMEDLTKRHHRKDVNTFLDRARKEGWIMRNPCELVAPPKIDDEDVSVIPVRDAFEFFKVNRDATCIGRVALEAFGGLRYTTAALIKKDNIKFPERGVEMAGSIHKSGKRKYRQGHPAALWAWLEHAPDACWNLSKRQYADEKKWALVNAKLRQPVASNEEEQAKIDRLRNVWRHSFASYMIAETKNVPKVGYLMQHKHTSTTEIYEGVASEADAKLYLAITPQTVKMTWEGFVKQFSGSQPPALTHHPKS